MNKRYILIFCALFSCSVDAHKKKSGKFPHKEPRESIFINPIELITPESTNIYFKHIFWDSGQILKHIFELSSMKVMTATVAFFLATKPADHIVHRQFYVDPLHKNKNTPSNFLQAFTTSDDAIIIPFLFFGSWGWFARDELLRRKSQVFVTGLIWVYFSKLILKEIVKHEVSERPYREEFCKQRLYGAIPSGHSAMFAYLAAYWGLQNGPTWGVPLTLFTLGVMAMNVATNRHYLSQVFVGAGLGVMFGVASSKTFDGIKKHEQFKLSLDTNFQGYPALTVAYDF